MTDRSDLRLYISDSNVTIKSISKEAAFQSTCNALFQRMIDTVPASVTLSDPIIPMEWKGVDLMLDVSSAGVVSVSGLIRNLYTATAPPVTVSYTTTNSGINSTTRNSDVTSGNGTSIFGDTMYWPFNSTISSPGTDTLTINSAVSYPVNDKIFVLPAQSSVNSGTKEIVLRGAVLTSLVGSDSMTGLLYVPTTQQGTITKKVTNVTVEMSSYGSAGNYTLFEGSVVASQATSIVAKVLLGDSASRTVRSDIFVGGL